MAPPRVKGPMALCANARTANGHNCMTITPSGTSSQAKQVLPPTGLYWRRLTRQSSLGHFSVSGTRRWPEAIAKSSINWDLSHYQTAYATLAPPVTEVLESAVTYTRRWTKSCHPKGTRCPCCKTAIWPVTYWPNSKVGTVAYSLSSV